jgi:uncharacterized protein (TIGR02646 family)
MILLGDKELDPGIQAVLDSLQNQITEAQTFEEKVSEAQSLWGTKGGKEGKEAFNSLKKELISLCVFTKICNYCEQNEASDIEHIHPKSYFPEFTFQWNNYILACKQCNSGHKLDKAYVLNENDEPILLKRGSEPPHHKIAFINIRVDDPQNYMIINPRNKFKFDLLPGLSKAERYKAEKTLEILELNTRDLLLAARKTAYLHYYFILERFNKMMKTTQKEELRKILGPFENEFDWTLRLDELKADIKKSTRNYIKKYQHPSVWESIKLFKDLDLRWKELFLEIPEASSW